MQTITEIGKEIASRQTHCYVCGNKLKVIRHECGICQELQCSRKCRMKHIRDMDEI